MGLKTSVRDFFLKRELKKLKGPEMDKVKAFLKTKAGMAVVAGVLAAAAVYSQQLSDIIKLVVNTVVGQ